MLSEDAVPLNERVLFAEGLASAEVLAAVRTGLLISPSPNGRVLFFDFAYADLALGKKFSFVFPKDRPQEAVATEAVIVAVTQQWGKPFGEIPDGWKTISLVEFPRGVPALVDALPVVDGWYVSDVAVCFANRDALTTLQVVAGSGTV